LCREQLPVWQAFYEKHKAENFELVAVAMDAAGPDKPRQFYDQHRVTFTRAVDQSDALWETLDFQVVPNGIFLDEQGIVRYAKFGGFEARDPEDVAAIEKLLASPVAASPASSPRAAARVPPGPARQWFQRGVEALQKGDKVAAAQYWRRALRVDPNNLVIRKQIWALEHPEQFYPKINPDWQRQQLAEERKKQGR